MIFIIYVLRKRTEVYHLKFSMDSKKKKSKHYEFYAIYGAGTILDNKRLKNKNKTKPKK